MLGRAARCAVVFAASGCASLGTADVHVETGNQPSGFLTRPLTLTVSTDESIQKVAQGICDNVKRGSSAEVTFVGKVPSPDPISLGDWGRYRYDCRAPLAMAKAAPPVAAPAPLPTAAPVKADAPVTADAAPASVAAPAAAAPAQGEASVRHGRDCLLQQGRYHVCVGNCLLSATSVGDAVAASCEQGCAPGLPAACR
jgi:hypothetical protein